MFENMNHSLNGKRPIGPREQKLAAKKLKLKFEDERETNQLQIGQHSTSKQKMNSQKAFEALGSLKPSILNIYSQNIEEDYHDATLHSPSKSPQTTEKLQKKQRRVRRNLSSIKRKHFNDSEESEENGNDKVSPRKRKMTMENKDEDYQQFSMIFPKVPSFIDSIHSSLKQKKESSKQLSEQQNYVLPSEKYEKIDINRHSQELLFFLDEQTPPESQENDRIQKEVEKNLQSGILSQNDTNNQKDNIKQKESIFQPSQSMLYKQNQINELMFDFDSKVDKQYFLQQEIPQGCRLVFEGIVQNNQIFNRQYTFWLNNGLKKMVLMSAKKNVKILEDYYLINRYDDLQRKQRFIAKLETNFQRRQFTLSNQSQFAEKKDKFIFSTLYTYSHINSKTQIFAYFPDFDHNTHMQQSLQIGSSSELLKKLLKIKEQNFNYLTSNMLDPDLERTIMKEHNLIKTKKTISLVDKNDQIKLYIGKTQSKRYKIIAGSGVSPLIVFAIFIVMIES